MSIYKGTQLISGLTSPIEPTKNIGQIITSTIPLVDAGLHLLDGGVIQGGGSYNAFVAYIADLYDSGAYTDIFETEANWQAAVTQYGVCGKFVYDDANNTVRLPKYSNKIYTSNLEGTAPVIGNGKALGLTVGGSTYGNLASYSASSYAFLYGNDSTTNNLNVGSSTTYSTANAFDNGKAVGVTTNSAKSGLIAQLSNITTSLEGYYYIVIATSTKTEIEVDIDEIATDLNGKADVDLTNVNDAGTSRSAGWAMPSGTCEDLTIGTSSTKYTASANGYVSFRCWATASGQFAQLNGYDSTETNVITYSTVYSTAANQFLPVCIPVRKGSKFEIWYSTTITTSDFLRFTYAQGSESEAS